MSVAEHLHPAAVLLRPEAADKWQLLHLMCEVLARANLLSQELLEPAVAALTERERSVSTGMEQGIAVPHAALEGLPGMVVGMALLPDGMDFEAMDGRPTEVVVLILVPKAEKLMHLQTLSEVARRLGDPRFKQELLQAEDGAHALALWAG
jgi:mannitol/fructose-specific phosphotransferase system IIA component (Ntr-type)